jgi:hypothetical protein
MVIGHDDRPEFREPKAWEIAEAAWDIVDEYLNGTDRYELHNYLGEVYLVALMASARANHATLDGTLKEWVNGAAAAMVAKWTPEEWESYRA